MSDDSPAEMTTPSKDTGADDGAGSKSAEARDGAMPQDTEPSSDEAVRDHGSKGLGKVVKFEAERPIQPIEEVEPVPVPVVDASEHSLQLADILRDMSHTSQQHPPGEDQAGAQTGGGSSSSISFDFADIVAPNKRQYSARSMISELSDGDHDDERSDDGGMPDTSLLRKEVDGGEAPLRRSHQSDSVLEAGEFSPESLGNRRRSSTKRTAVARQADGNLEAALHSSLHSSLTMNFNLTDLRDSIVKHRRPTAEGESLGRRSSIDSAFGTSRRQSSSSSGRDSVSSRRDSINSRRDSINSTGKYAKRTSVDTAMIKEVSESQIKNLEGDVSSDESADEFRDSFTFGSAGSSAEESGSTHQSQVGPGFGAYLQNFTRRKFRANGATPIQMIENQFFIPPPDEGQTFVQSLSYTIRGYGNEFVIWIYQAPFFTVLVFCLIFYFAMVFAFAGILLAFEVNSEGKCTSPAYGMFTRGELYELAFELSWTTFTTTGYGIVSPSGSETGCYGIRFACSMFAFLGLLFNRCGRTWHAPHLICLTFLTCSHHRTV